MTIEQLHQKYRDLYGKSAERVYFAPGRINLIGEHVDYNGGLVFPCALDFGTYLLVAARDDRKSGFATLNFPEAGTLDVSAFENKPDSWQKYPLGVMKEFAEKGFDPWGFDMLFYGDLPNGAGLSSSASIEVVTTMMLNDVLNAGTDRVEWALVSQRAENRFVGMHSGIMDQFAVSMGKKDCAIVLDCLTLAYELVPLKMEGYRLVIVNSNKQRKLTDSKYNERRAECERGLHELNRELKLEALCQLNMHQFEAVSHLIKDETIFRRVRHVISENDRVKEAVDVLKSGDLSRFGSLMNASHHSLKTDYEVTGVELDTLAETAQTLPGVLGARMTGAGFGGCTVNLVASEAIAGFIEELGKKYTEQTGLKADFYVANIGDGVRQLS